MKKLLLTLAFVLGLLSLDTVGSSQYGYNPEGIITATGTLTAAQIRTLNATPVEILAAPAAGYAIAPVDMQFHLDYNSNVYDSVGAGEDLQIQYATGGTRIGLADCDASANCINPGGAADDHGWVYMEQTRGRPLLAATAVNITILSAEWATTDDDSDGDSPIHWKIRYRLIQVDLT